MRNKTWKKEITVRLHRCYCWGNMPFGICESFTVITSANCWFTAPLAWLLCAIVKIKSAFLKSVFLWFYGLKTVKKANVPVCDIRVCDLCFCAVWRYVCALWTAVGVSLSAFPQISGDTSVPTHESVSCFDVYLIKLHLIPNVARPLVLDNKEDEHKGVAF